MLDFLKRTIREAGDIAKKYYVEGVSYTQKSHPSDVLTIADTTVSNFLIEKIKEKYPEHGIISEEEREDHNPDAEYVWVIDPIDGTRNFANHIPLWCNMIGITKNSVPYMGAVYDPIHNELFFAEQGRGAFVNDKQIHVSDYPEVSHCFIVYSSGVEGGEYEGDYSSTHFQDYKRFFNNLLGDDGHWIQNHGNMVPACYLAAGRIDALVFNSGLYHDYLASYVIATEAGAKWTNSKGEEWKRGQMDIVVANPILHPKLLQLFK